MSFHSIGMVVLLSILILWTVSSHAVTSSSTLSGRILPSLPYLGTDESKAYLSADLSVIPMRKSTSNSPFRTLVEPTSKRSHISAVHNPQIPAEVGRKRELPYPWISELWETYEEDEKVASMRSVLLEWMYDDLVRYYGQHNSVWKSRQKTFENLDLKGHEGNVTFVAESMETFRQGFFSFSGKPTTDLESLAKEFDRLVKVFAYPDGANVIWPSPHSFLQKFVLSTRDAYGNYLVLDRYFLDLFGDDILRFCSHILPEEWTMGNAHDLLKKLIPVLLESQKLHEPRDIRKYVERPITDFEMHKDFVSRPQEMVPKVTEQLAVEERNAAQCFIEDLVIVWRILDYHGYTPGVMKLDNSLRLWMGHCVSPDWEDMLSMTVKRVKEIWQRLPPRVWRVDSPKWSGESRNSGPWDDPQSSGLGTNDQ